MGKLILLTNATKLGKVDILQSIQWIILYATQTLHEPGDDSTRYDTLLTTVVRPPETTGTEDGEDNMQLGILKQFTFSSELQVRSLHPLFNLCEHII